MLARPLALAALPLSLVACRSANPPSLESRPPLAETGPAEVARPSTDAGPVSSPPPVQPALHLDRGSFAGPWVALGGNLVDATTGRRARGVPRGDVYASADGERILAFDTQEVIAGRARTEQEDIHVPFAPVAKSSVQVLLSPTGKAALVCADSADEAPDDRVLVIDAVKKTSLVARRDPRGAGGCVVSDDGRRVAWVDGASVVVRDLDAETTRTFNDAGDASKPAIAGGLLGAIWSGVLVVRSLASGDAIVRRPGTAHFTLRGDGKAVAWVDAREAQLFSIGARRVTGTVVLAHDPAGTAERGPFAGACGGGEFGAIEDLRGSAVTLRRDCSLIDVFRVDLATGKVLSLESHTPAEEADAEARVAAACAKANRVCSDAFVAQSANMELHGGQWLVLPGRPPGVFEAGTGKAISVLAESDQQAVDDGLFAAPNGETLVGVDARGVGRVWDAATGRVLFEVGR